MQTVAVASSEVTSNGDLQLHARGLGRPSLGAGEGASEQPGLPPEPPLARGMALSKFPAPLSLRLLICKKVIICAWGGSSGKE